MVKRTAGQSEIIHVESQPRMIEPRGKETLAQAALRVLRHDIIHGTRAPEERLRIEKLKMIYAIGPTPLREALQMLVAEGLVLTEGNRGFTVAPLDYDEFLDLNIARTAIERAALGGLDSHFLRQLGRQ